MPLHFHNTVTLIKSKAHVRWKKCLDYIEPQSFMVVFLCSPYILFEYHIFRTSFELLHPKMVSDERRHNKAFMFSFSYLKSNLCLKLHFRWIITWNINTYHVDKLYLSPLWFWHGCKTLGQTKVLNACTCRCPWRFSEKPFFLMHTGSRGIP